MEIYDYALPNNELFYKALKSIDFNETFKHPCGFHFQPLLFILVVDTLDMMSNVFKNKNHTKRGININDGR